MTYALTTLSGGLRVASHHLSGIESVAIAISVDVGARHEGEAEHGLSHLLEHMAFKGTETRSAQAIAEAFDAIGGQFNAYTSMESTVYHVKVLKEYIEVAVEILADIFQRSIFDTKELEREKGVIIQEIAMHKDTPDDVIVDLFDATCFPKQALGRTILGTEEGVSAFTSQDVAEYMRHHYRPQHMVISAAGAVTHEALVQLIEHYFPLEATTDKPLPVNARYTGGDARVARTLEQLQFMMGFPGVTVHDEQFFTQQLFATILGGGMSSRLFQEIREKRGLVYHISAFANAYPDTGLMGIYAATAPEQAAELVRAIAEEVMRLPATVTSEELTRAKNQLKAEILMGRESPAALAAIMGRHLLVFDQFRTASDMQHFIDAVQLSDIALFAEQTLTHHTIALATLGDVSQVPEYNTVEAAFQ